ncbi:hypothetical protein BJP36_38115 [Moorena producens JHB]|uniref:Uncharacterized protein n=1 Tax=Moorena producens (strain JHB) TaxID=1454205 RepID=A0A9Q9SUJ9_MOOP1|nr:hypothetical protein [Moorena producens]WAN69910.1 hypothetical protein BJP36_38115 [Moorena producens JHB]
MVYSQSDSGRNGQVIAAGIGNRGSGIGNRESGIGNRESGIGNRESGEELRRVR